MTSQPDESPDPAATAEDAPGVAALAQVVDALNATTTELAATKAEVKRLRTYGRRNRAFIVFDVLLTILLAGVGGISVHAAQSANSANHSANQSNSAQLALCQASNTARAQQIDLWTFVISLSKKPQTAQQKKNIEAFEKHLNVIFAARDCSHLGR